MGRFRFLAHVLIAGAAVLFALSSATAQQGMNTSGGQSQRPSESRIAVAELSEQFRTISLGGRLQPKSRIVHLTPTRGYIQSLAVEEGQRVEKGQELFQVARKDDVANIYKPAVVTARIAGYISEVFVQVEDQVEADDPAVVIVGTEGYELVATASDKDVFKVGIGQQVSARTSGGGRITGVLVSRSQEPNYATGLFSLTFRFPNSQNTYVGEFVVIELPADRAQGLFVRRDLVTRRYGKYFLWIVNADQELEAREVVLGPTYGDLVMIRQGLKVGERYLTRLTGREKEGARIDA